jgi:hypothetical protein
MRITYVVVAAFLGLFISAHVAAAKEVAVGGTHSESQVKKDCGNAGGDFSSYGGIYGCSTNCHGGAGSDCAVSCSKGKCTGQVPGMIASKNRLSNFLVYGKVGPAIQSQPNLLDNKLDNITQSPSATGAPSPAGVPSAHSR